MKMLASAVENGIEQRQMAKRQSVQENAALSNVSKAEEVEEGEEEEDGEEKEDGVIVEIVEKLKSTPRLKLKRKRVTIVGGGNNEEPSEKKES